MLNINLKINTNWLHTIELPNHTSNNNVSKFQRCTKNIFTTYYEWKQNLLIDIVFAASGSLMF